MALMHFGVDVLKSLAQLWKVTWTEISRPRGYQEAIYLAHEIHVASGLDESANGHLMTTMQSSHELHNLYTLHFKLPLSTGTEPELKVRGDSFTVSCVQ